MLSAIVLLSGCRDRSGSGGVARPPNDVDAIAAALLAQPGVRSAAVVGFGETSHGTLEFRQLPYTFAFEFAKSHDEVTLALEADPIAGLWLNEYGHGCGNLGADAPDDGEPMAGSNAELIRRARAHHDTGNGCVRIVGVDALVSPYAAMTLEGAGRGCLAERWSPRIGSLVVELHHLRAEFGTGGTRAPEVLAEVSAEVGTIDDSHECATFEYLLAALHDTIEITPPDSASGRVPEFVHTTDRDTIMARNVAYWARRSKVVFLAHAGHTAAVEIPDVRGGGATTTAGVHLRRELGAGYVNVGMHFGDGELAALRCSGARRPTVRRIPRPRHPSFERDLLRDLDTATLLSAAVACNGRECDVSRQYVYCLPLGFDDTRVSYLAIDLRQAFDWFVFFPHAQADDPMPSRRPPRPQR